MTEFDRGQMNDDGNRMLALSLQLRSFKSSVSFVPVLPCDMLLAYNSKKTGTSTQTYEVLSIGKAMLAS